MDILTPVGRIVQGDVFKGHDKDMDGNPLTDKQGNPRQSFFIALAISKQDPAVQPLLAQMQQEANASWPQGQAQRPDFAFKMLDGDAPANKDKEGFAGHYILRFNSSFAPKCYSKGGQEVITDPNAIKRGYYVRVFGQYKSNQSNVSPGS